MPKRLSARLTFFEFAVGVVVAVLASVGFFVFGAAGLPDEYRKRPDRATSLLVSGAIVSIVAGVLTGVRAARWQRDFRKKACKGERERCLSEPTCPCCGYDLQCAGDLRCPECGERFTAEERSRGHPQREGPQV